MNSFKTDQSLNKGDMFITLKKQQARFMNITNFIRVRPKLHIYFLYIFLDSLIDLCVGVLILQIHNIEDLQHNIMSLTQQCKHNFCSDSKHWCRLWEMTSDSREFPISDLV